MSRHERIRPGGLVVTGLDVFDTVAELRARGQPFCLATVVRTADLTSAKAGAKAVVTAEGEVIGHLGGGCVRGAVTRAAAEVLATGAARMISVQPGEAAAPHPDVEVHASGCPSGGTVDVFIEPYLQPLRVSVVGDGPIARALRVHGQAMGYAGLDGDAGGSDAVIIASQGTGDLAALRTALQGPAAFVAMVASHRKAAHLKERLRGEGMDPARLDALVSPAGLDIGAIDPQEIAVSVIAQVIAWRRQTGAG